MRSSLRLLKGICLTNRPDKTAIHRKQPSAPARMLDQRGLVKGRVLDHGSGHGKDAETFGWEKYDPYFHPDEPKGRFDTILSTFVLNVLPDEQERQAVLEDIRDRLTDSGAAYITVRADTDQLKGWTSKGTWQGLIELNLPVVHHTSWYTTYLLESD